MCPCVRRKKTLTLAKKTHLTNKKYIRRSLKNLFANVRPWICKFAISSKKSQPKRVLSGWLASDPLLDFGRER